MHHARQLSNVESITSIGLRDISPEEAEIIRNDTHINVYSDKYLANQRLDLRPFNAVIEEILENLPKKIYLSFDVDCLDPSLCPNTELLSLADSVGMKFKPFRCTLSQRY